MRFLTWILLLCLGITSGWSAPLYRAGQTDSSASNWLHGEISAGYVFSNNSLEDYLGQLSSSSLRGWNARALWAPLPWLAAGVEYTRFGKVKLTPALVDGYVMSRMGAVVKVILSPDTNPRFYFLGGYGSSVNSLDFTSTTPSYEKRQSYWMAGLGVETVLYKAVFVAAEGSVYWNKSSHLHTLYRLSSRVETDLGLRTGIRF